MRGLSPRSWPASGSASTGVSAAGACWCDGRSEQRAQGCFRRCPAGRNVARALRQALCTLLRRWRWLLAAPPALTPAPAESCPVRFERTRPVHPGIARQAYRAMRSPRGRLAPATHRQAKVALLRQDRGLRGAAGARAANVARRPSSSLEPRNTVSAGRGSPGARCHSWGQPPTKIPCRLRR